MRIGLTYDLRDDYLAEGFSEEQTAEFDTPETIAGIESALIGLGFDVQRIGNVRALVTALARGQRWDLVFNIAEGMNGLSREAQVPALLDAYGIRYTFSDPLTMSLTLDKAMAKRVVRDHGIATAPFIVIESERSSPPAREDFPLFLKPLGEGTGKGISAASHVATRSEFVRTCRTLLREHRQPVLAEAYLPGREFTVGIVGHGQRSRVIGVMEIEFGEKAEAWGYSYDNKEHYEDRVSYRLAGDTEARQAGRTALSAWRALRCCDGGRVDLRSDAEGVPHFLEVNPLAGLHPGRSDLVILARLAGIRYDALIGQIVQASFERHRLAMPVAASEASA